MPGRPKAVAFDVDSDSLASLRQAFPQWEIATTNGATTGSLKRDWNPGAVELLVVGAHDQVAETLGLCRGLRSQAGRAQTPLLVLVRALLAAGADSCLVLPVHAKDLVCRLTCVRAGNQPGRHTLGVHQSQREDRWRDHGGEA